jgi:hypothetical protein
MDDLKHNLPRFLDSEDKTYLEELGLFVIKLLTNT